MRLYIVRHGEAEGQLTTDEARALTERGREHVAQLWQVLADRGVTPSRIINSPYVCAKQTAAITAVHCPPAFRKEWHSITPAWMPSRIFEELARLVVSEDSALVSHMPFEGLLCGVRTDPPRHPSPVGSVACIHGHVS